MSRQRTEEEKQQDAVLGGLAVVACIGGLIWLYGKKRAKCRFCGRVIDPSDACVCRLPPPPPARCVVVEDDVYDDYPPPRVVRRRRRY